MEELECDVCHIMAEDLIEQIGGKHPVEDEKLARRLIANVCGDEVPPPRAPPHAHTHAEKHASPPFILAAIPLQDSGTPAPFLSRYTAFMEGNDEGYRMRPKAWKPAADK